MASRSLTTFRSATSSSSSASLEVRLRTWAVITTFSYWASLSFCRSTSITSFDETTLFALTLSPFRSLCQLAEHLFLVQAKTHSLLNGVAELHVEDAAPLCFDYVSVT